MKLFLKGERCFGQKCEIVKRNYPPGIRSKKRGRKISEYGKELMEKQKLRNWYGLAEKQFKKYVKDILSAGGKTENTGDLLIKRIESRLDNIIFRMGLVSSRAEARQLVNHGHILINGKKVDIPSFEVEKGDEIEVSGKIKGKKKLQEIQERLKVSDSPAWIFLDKSEIKGKVLDLPTAEEADVPVETSVIFEFYSK